MSRDKLQYEELLDRYKRLSQDSQHQKDSFETQLEALRHDNSEYAGVIAKNKTTISQMQEHADGMEIKIADYLRYNFQSLSS